MRTEYEEREVFEKNRPGWMKRLDNVLYYFDNRGDKIMAILGSVFLIGLGSCTLLLALWVVGMILFVWGVKQ